MRLPYGLKIATAALAVCSLSREAPAQQTLPTLNAEQQQTMEDLAAYSSLPFCRIRAMLALETSEGRKKGIPSWGVRGLESHTRSTTALCLPRLEKGDRQKPVPVRYADVAHEFLLSRRGHPVSAACQQKMSTFINVTQLYDATPTLTRGLMFGALMRPVAQAAERVEAACFGGQRTDIDVRASFSRG